MSDLIPIDPLEPVGGAESTRREALRNIAIAALLGPLAEDAAAQVHQHVEAEKKKAPGAAYRPKHLTADELETLGVLSDLIIPGARKAGAAEFIERLSAIAVDTGGIVLAQGETVSLDRGVLGAAMGGEVRVVQSAANLVGARDTIVDQSLVMSVIGADVTIRQPSAIGVLIAGRVEGSVRPILDWRGALAFGAAFALISTILRRR